MQSGLLELAIKAVCTLVMVLFTPTRNIISYFGNSRRFNLLKFEREKCILLHHLPDLELEPLKFENDERILLHHFPVLIWQLVFDRLTTNFQVVESCTEVSPFFHDFILQSFENLSIGPDQILPSVYREWIPNFDFQSNPTDLLLKLVDVKPRLSTFEIQVTPNFRPEDNVLGSVLEIQSKSLHTFHISSLGIEEKPLVLYFPENNKLRVVRIVRSVTKRNQVSLEIPQSIHSVLLALESLTLSLWGHETWSDFLRRPDNGRRVYKRLKHLCFVDYEGLASWNELALLRASLLFLKLGSLELPARIASDSRDFWVNPLITQTKQLTLSGGSDPDVHCLDRFITRYDEETCNAILGNPEGDPQETHWKVGQRRYLGRDLPLQVLEIFRELTQMREKVVPIHLSRLKEIRINYGNGDIGPTVVCLPTLLNLSSLKKIVFCGGYPKHIPEEMLNKLRDRFQIVYRQK